LFTLGVSRAEVDAHVENVQLSCLCAAHPDEALGHDVLELNDLAVSHKLAQLAVALGMIVFSLKLGELLEAQHVVLARVQLWSS